MKRRSPIAIAICLVMSTIFTGCGSSADTALEDKSVSTEKNMTSESDSKDEDASIKNNETVQIEETPETNNKADEDEPSKDTVADKSEDDKTASKSLAERLVGKYSYLVSGENGEELLTMDVVNFGDNLYAYCGYSLPDEGTFTLYSFFATEFIPYDANEIKSPDGDSVEVNELRFSIMSNAGEYWDSGHTGTITLTEDGLLFEGFDHDGFLVPEDDDSRLFFKDEQVEGAFSYLKHEQDAGDKDLQGFWALGDSDPDLYLEFDGSDMYIYRKYPDQGVFFSAGGCDFHDGSFDCTASSIWNGGMPFEFSADYKVEGDSLILETDSTERPEGFASRNDFHRILKNDIHVTAMDEVVLNWESFGPIGKAQQDPFYGVWLGAFKEKTDAEALVVRLEDEGISASYVYSCDWENLNNDPYYCVTLGKFYTEQEAKDDIDNAKHAGYENAYVKYTGERLGHRVNYTVFDESKISISPTEAVLKDVAIDDFSGENTGDVTLIVDSNTLFDDSCELQFFAYYQDGMTPLDWFNHINEIRDTEEYQAQGGALMGVFEVDITGNHVDKFYGSYWWD